MPLTKSQSQAQGLEFGKEQLKMCCPAPGNFGLSQRSQIVCFLSVYFWDVQDLPEYSLLHCVENRAFILFTTSQRCSEIFEERWGRSSD